MNNGCFDLTSSAFHILKAGYDANRSDIAELVEDAEFDEVFEPQKIQRAQQSLLAPNARLEQEISWLPELSQAQTTNVLSLVASGDLEALIGTSKHAPELAKANILAHFAGTGNVSDRLFHALVSAWDEIDQENILIFLNDNRLSAGFPGIERPQMRNALVELEKKHARSAAVGIWSLDRPGEVMDRIVEAELRRHPASSFLEQFVRNYDTFSEPDLARISDEIDKVISEAENTDANLEALVTKASDLLDRWDDVNQPVQVYEQHQGHEEGRSKRIYEKLRSLCLDLANNRSEFAEARRLSEALLRTFPELESVAEVLKGDVAALENLDEQQKLHEEYKPLIDACEAAKTKLPTPVSTVLKVFKDTVSKGSDDPIAFNILRDLALHINNDCNDPQTAFKLLDGALTFAGARPPKELGKTLEEERAVLHRNWKMNELEKNSGNLTAMSQTVDDMLKYARGSERSELQQLKAKLDRKKLGKKVKWGIYASIAAVIGFIVIADEMDKPSNRSTYQPSAPRVATPAPTPAPATSATVETRPPVGQGLTLNRSQIRYCVFQGQRLETIRTLTTTNYQIDRFNGLIDDFNSRCSSYRYRSGVLSSVQREAREKAVDLRADARRIVASW
ncbi:hypothetical protein [Marivita cryptomonadis]|uniref:hypothetical protein n=1 Tax=Marivita cryptomonadis TaxID=505252 RepID=UPI00193973DA|nr:hypothetical protein [Marivita cryptomonadis]MBM2430149.1 hypothetical protein [Marivita cryptomonadis]MBM2448803.1 hypothetical protein [Marivita cryptomonadis]MBM2462794.1 hypothetical protein [Marivita cryptomonadis]MBM2471157.1 hypothetical protein [Marivita cryptomonadis]MBM2476789.1 hypothetical protein [Marivita cryptomonadis]